MNGQILRGDDYGQNSAGTGVGAYVPDQQNTHDSQRAIEHVYQLNKQYQDDQDAAQQKEQLRRQKATADISLDPTGIRSVDRDSILANQKTLNDYVSHAFATQDHDHDPTNPGTEEWTKAQAMKNTLATQIEASKQLNKQIADETKLYTAKDGAKNYDKSSEDKLALASSIPLQDYLKGYDSQGNKTKIGLGSTFLDKADNYDPQKDWNEYVGKLPKKQLAAKELYDQYGAHTGTMNSIGTDTPADIDPLTGQEKELTSGRSLAAAEMLRKPKYAQYVQEQLHGDPTRITASAPIYEEAARRSQASRATGGPEITPEQVFAEKEAAMRLGNQGKVDHDPAYAIGLRGQQQRATAAYKSQLKNNDDKQGDQIGRNMYQTLAGIQSGDPSYYTKQPNGELRAKGVPQFLIGTYDVQADPNKPPSKVPNHITDYKIGTDGALYIKTDESSYNAGANTEAAWTREPDIIKNKLGSIIQNHGNIKNKKQADAAFAGLNNEAQVRGEITPTGGYDYGKHGQSVAGPYGKEITDAQAEDAWNIAKANVAAKNKNKWFNIGGIRNAKEESELPAELLSNPVIQKHIKERDKGESDPVVKPKIKL